MEIMFRCGLLYLGLRRDLKGFLEKLRLRNSHKKFYFYVSFIMGLVDSS